MNEYFDLLLFHLMLKHLLIVLFDIKTYVKLLHISIYRSTTKRKFSNSGFMG